MKKIFLFILTSVYMFAMSPDVDAYTEFEYDYYKDGIRIDAHNIIKYSFNKSKNQYGSRDILLYSLKHLAKEVQSNGYKNFYLLYNNKEKKKAMLIDKLLQEFNPLIQSHMVYNYQNGRPKNSIGLGSFLALAGNIVVTTVGVTTGNTDLVGHGLTGVMSDKKGNLLNDILKSDNRNELNALKNRMIYDISDLTAFAGIPPLKEESFEYYVLLDVNDINSYFKNQNPFRIKELNTTNKNYFMRGLKSE